MATKYTDRDHEGKVLVLLYGYNESEQCILGFKFCEELLRRGHHLLVTTTTPRNQLWWEEGLTKHSEYKGMVTLVQPQHEEDEKPQPEWIGKYHRTYFPRLSTRKDVKCIVGMLPGTTNTGIDLKKDLNCKLVLLATSKLHFDQYNFHVEIDKLNSANEIWSIGCDMFNHYEATFKGAGGTAWSKHKMFFLKPDTPERTKTHFYSSGIQTLVSVWRHGNPYLYKGGIAKSKGSSEDNFVSVGAALGRINEARGLIWGSRLTWLVHGLKGQEHVLGGIQKQGQGYTNDITTRMEAQTQDEIMLQGPSALIVPDRTEDSFNFTALSALWQGVPTIVSYESSIGKLLLFALGDCAVMKRALVRLTGEIDTDTDIWMNKLCSDLLNDDARPFEWAKELKNYLHSRTELWQSDFSIFDRATVEHTTARSEGWSPFVFYRRHDDVTDVATSQGVITKGTDQAISHLENTYPGRDTQLFYDCVLAIHEAKNQLLENIERADELLSRAPAPSIRGSNKSKRYSNGTSDDHDDDDTDSSRMRKKNMKLE